MKRRSYFPYFKHFCLAGDPFFRMLRKALCYTIRWEDTGRWKFQNKTAGKVRKMLCLVILTSQKITAYSKSQGFNSFASTGFPHFPVPSSERQIWESIPFFVHRCASGLQFSWNILPVLMELKVVYLSMSSYKEGIVMTRGSPAVLLHWNMSKRERGSFAKQPWCDALSIPLGPPSWGRLRENQAWNWGERQQPAEPRQLSAWMQAARGQG